MNRLSQGVRLTFLNFILLWAESLSQFEQNQSSAQDTRNALDNLQLHAPAHDPSHVPCACYCWHTYRAPIFLTYLCELSVNYLHFYGKSERVNILAEKRWGLIPREATPAAYLNAIVVCPSDCDDGKKTKTTTTTHKRLLRISTQRSSTWEQFDSCCTDVSRVRSRAVSKRVPCYCE